MNSENQDIPIRMEDRTMFDFDGNWSSVMKVINTPEMQTELSKTLKLIARQYHMSEIRTRPKYPVCLYFDLEDDFARSQFMGILKEVGYLEQAENYTINFDQICDHFLETYDNPFWWVFPSKHWMNFQLKIAQRLMPTVDWRLYYSYDGSMIVGDAMARYLFGLSDWLGFKQVLKPAELTTGLAFDMFCDEHSSFCTHNPRSDGNVYRVYEEANFFAPDVIFQSRIVPSVSSSLIEAEARLTRRQKSEQSQMFSQTLAS